MNLAEKNPLAVRAAVTAAVTGLVHVAVVFGLVDVEQATAIGGAVDAAGLLVFVLWARAGVTPNAKVITQVTTKGVVVAGDAAVMPTGDELDVSRAGDLALVDSVLVKPELVSRHRRGARGAVSVGDAVVIVFLGIMLLVILGYVGR